MNRFCAAVNLFTLIVLANAAHAALFDQGNIPAYFILLAVGSGVGALALYFIQKEHE